MSIETILKFSTATLGLFAAFWAIYLYGKQQKFKRLQNLNLVFQRFADSQDLLEIFSLCESLDSNPQHKEASETLKKLSVQSKLKFLALLDEIGLYSELGEVDNKYAVYLFQWHFYYIYNKTETSQLFWKELGGIEESKQSYWGKSYSFAQKCNPKINK